VTDAIQTGQQIWVRKVGDAWWLAQVPDVNSALVSINPQNGAVMALVGGFDFNQSKFNRATQALRQVGSNIKPFLYTAAMDKGLTLASILNDVPIFAGMQVLVLTGSRRTPRRNMPARFVFVRVWGSRKTW
jgi:penicillin-binding protein 1A